MIFVSSMDCYAKVWKVDKKEKYMDLRISTSEKDDANGGFKNSTWFPRLIGHAFNSLKDTLNDGDRIHITKCKFTNESYKTEDGQSRSAFRMLVLEAEKMEAGGKKAEAPAHPQPAQQKKAEAPAADDDCPW